MNSFPSWLSGDPTLIWGLSVLLQVTVITTVALIVARCARRIPVLRYWILCSSLFLVLLTPCLTLVMQLSGISFLTLSVPQDFPRVTADLTESRHPVVASFPSSSRENSGDDAERVRTVVESTSDALAWEPSEEYLRAHSYGDPASSGANASDASGSAGVLHSEVAASASRFASPQSDFPRIGDLPRLVMRPLMFIWFTGTLFFLARLIVNWCRLAVMLRSVKSVVSAPVALLLEEVARESGVRQVPEIVFSARVVSPISAGLIRPRVILPERLVDRVNREQLRDILLHELAHIERRDQAIVLMQHLSVALFWLHPLVSLLNRELAKAREEVCDNFVLAATDGPSYSRTLLALTELVQTMRPLPGAVGLFTAHWKLEHRIAGLLDDRRNRMTRLTTRGKTTICLLSLGIAALAAMGTLTPAASQEEQAELSADTDSNTSLEATTPATSPDDDDAVAPTVEPTFELIVVGPNGQPVPNANVELRTKPLPTAAQITVGEFVRQGTYGTMVTTDTEGRLMVMRPDPSSGFSVSVMTPGYGPYWAEWNPDKRPQPVPSRFVAELDEGWTVGGVVVNSQGEPIAGAAVRPSIRWKKRPGDTEDLGVGTRIVTDADGKWRFDSVPVSMNEVFVAISHSDFMSNRRALTRSEFGLTRAESPAALVELQRGLVVRGRVTDESGHPVSDALLRTKFLNDIRESRTDAEGNYEIMGCEPKMARIVVSAPGFATDLREVRVDPDMERVNFVMQPGGKIRIHVVDEQGNGIPRARIFFQGWRGRFNYFAFDHVSQYADENGVWEWHEAPLDEFQADICRPGGMQLSRQSLMARDEEYIFSPPPPLVVSGSVVDAATKQPIEKFRVIPGLRNLDPEIRMNWNTREAFDASAGEYRVVFSHDYPAHLVRIEAEGYRVAISRDIKSDEGDVAFDFELRPAEDIAATIVTPFGEPASGAKIALGVAGSQISIRNGDIDDGSTYATRLEADADGRFRIPDRGESFQLVMSHPSGFAYLKPDEQEIPRTIRLTPWARVEGVFRVGPAPVANVKLTLDTHTIHSYGADVPNIFTHHEVTTGPEGQYVFERVIPGNGRIGRSILLMVDDGAAEVTSSKRVAAQFPPGETTVLDLGGDGCAVVGQILPPPNLEQPPLWNFALVEVSAFLPPLDMPMAPPEVQNDPELYRAWRQKWEATPDGRAWRSARDTYQALRAIVPRFTATVARDGTFRIDDVPSGSYVLSVRFSQRHAGQLSGYRFSVPAFDRDELAPLVDLGELQLQ